LIQTKELITNEDCSLKSKSVHAQWREVSVHKIKLYLAVTTHVWCKNHHYKTRGAKSQLSELTISWDISGLIYD
jgi:hypothetical protein